jgi:hypothetical protein
MYHRTLSIFSMTTLLESRATLSNERVKHLIVLAVSAFDPERLKTSCHLATVSEDFIGRNIQGTYSR